MPKQISYEKQERILKDPDHKLRPNVVVMRRMHDQRISAQEVAEFLKKTRSAVSKMLNRPGAVLPHASKLAKFLDMEEAEIVGHQRPSRHQPATPPPPRPDTPPLRTIETVLESELGKLDANTIPLGVSWSLVRVEVPGGTNWFLCAPISSKPREGDEVIVTTKDSRVWHRYYNLDEFDQSRVVLTSRGNGDRPMVLNESDIHEMRRVVGQLANLR